MNGVGVQVSVVLARAKRTILLCDKEERGGLWGFRRDYSSSFKVFVDEHFTGFLFLRVEGIYLGNFGNKRRFKVDGVVVGSMGRKYVVGFLREHIFEIRTPIGDFLIRGFRCLGKFGGQGDLIEMFAIEILLREVLTERCIVLRRISLGEK